MPSDVMSEKDRQYLYGTPVEPPTAQQINAVVKLLTGHRATELLDMVLGDYAPKTAVTA